MPTSGLNPAIVGQAEKAHAAILHRLLAETTLDQQQWITLQFSAGADGALGRGVLIARVRGAAQYDHAVVQAAIAALISASLIAARVLTTITDKLNEELARF
jgi:hypothetical protein